MNSTEIDPAREPLLAEPGGRAPLLLGNEAIVRGALEAGVYFTCGYPGTPSSEITDGFARLAPKLGLAFEYSVNEKVALEMAYAASLAGARSIVAMKHLGLMYAGDPLTTMPYIGTVGGMVIVSGGDPSCRTSPNEQDQRQLANMLHIPVLDPGSPQEALDMTRFAFELSEQSGLPVILRPTTWVCHTRAPVQVGPLRKPEVTGFKRDPMSFVPVPAIARKMRVRLLQRVEKARELMARSGFFRRSGTGRIGVAGCGAAGALVGDLLQEGGHDQEVVMLHLGGAFPLPETWILEQLRGLDKLLIVEELSPFLEDALRALCSLHGVPTTILGKRTGHLPEPFEYDAPILKRALHAALQIGSPPDDTAPVPATPPPPVPPRPPILCAACPHRSAFFSARAAFGKEALFFNDIGCYTLGFGPPLHSADALLCMGAGFTLAAGVSRTTGERTVGFMGDSTFFHSGMPPLLNAVKEKANIVAVIMDNQVTAMTGFQESPGITVEENRLERHVNIEGIVRALGVDQVVTVDPNDLAVTTAAFRRARDQTGVSVIITERACPVYATKAAPASCAPAPDADTFTIRQDQCRHCGLDGSGHRCSQTVSVPFERSMSRARALETGTEGDRAALAACSQKCPLLLCVQGYATHIAGGRYDAALELIMERLPLPDSVCRVCHRPCEDACVRAGTDGAVAINDLKRFVVDWADRQPDFPYQPILEAEHGRHVAVVGAGPAGLAAAHDLRLRGYGVTLYDENAEAGGLLLTGIPRYRLPLDALRRDVARVLAIGVRFEGGRRLGEDLSLTTLANDHDAVVLTVGAQRGLTLDVPGEGPPLVDALTWLRGTRGEGVAGQAAQVVVIGGGDSAIDASRTALRCGAVAATVACLEIRAEMPGVPSEVDEALHEGVILRNRFRAVRREPGAIVLVAVQQIEPDRVAPDNFEDVPGTEVRVPADLVIVAIGQEPDAEALGLAPGTVQWSGPWLAFDPETGATGTARVHAAGDLGGGTRTVTDAIAGGLRAAHGVDRALRSREEADRRLPPPIVDDGPALRRSGITRIDSVARAEVPTYAPDSLCGNFEEIRGPLSEAAAQAEAERCMVCGHCGNCRSCLDLFGCPAFYVEAGRIEIAAALCTGCGVCADFCPNGAIVPLEAK